MVDPDGATKRDNQPDIELLRLQFEREKWQAELAKIERDFALREREQINRDDEIKLKREEQAASKWRSPLTVAILAAAIAGLGNAAVTALNGSLQRNLDDSKRSAELALEESKAESTRILEMIKTGNTETAAKNISFLLDTGLIATPQRAAKLKDFLANRLPGTGPALPAASRFEVVPGDMTKSVQTKLQVSLEGFIAYLDSIGFPPGKKVLVRVKDEVLHNVVYMQDLSEVWIGPDSVDDVSGPLQQYGVSILLNGKDTSREEIQGIGFGTADYLTASFLQNPRVGEGIAKASNLSKPYLRTMLNERKFTKLKPKPDSSEHLDQAEIWGGLFWELRQRLTREKFDPILAKTWLSVKFPPNRTDVPAVFVTALLANASDQSAEIQDALKKRDFPTGK